MIRSALPLLLTACVLQSERYQRPRDLDPGWLADRPRLLAIQAEPPDLLPGERSALRALFADPSGELSSTLWIGCPEERASSFGCAPDPALFDPDATPADLAEAGLIGFEPGFPPVATAPADYLDGLDARGLQRGRPYFVTAIGLPADADGDPDDLDFNSLRAGFKRIMVTGREPNRNPVIEALLLDGRPLPLDEPIQVDPGETLLFAVQLADGSIEDYDHLNPAGEIERRTEALLAEWYASSGEIRRATTLHPFLYSDWIAPEESGSEGSVWVVVKDRRGGLTWWHQRWRVR